MNRSANVRASKLGPAHSIACLIYAETSCAPCREAWPDLPSAEAKVAEVEEAGHRSKPDVVISAEGRGRATE